MGTTHSVRAGIEKERERLGRKIESFRLEDSSGKPWSLADAGDARVVVVVFVGTECLVNNAYMSRLVEQHGTYGPRGVRFVAINSNRQDTVQRLTAHARHYALPFPVLRDEGNTIADRFGAEKTPEVFVLDSSRIVRYVGRIDDQFGVGFRRGKPTRHDLTEALEEILAGKPVAVASTKVEGCFIARMPRPKTNATVTYVQHVAPILLKNCAGCHRPGQIGPMPLLNYDDASAWAETIRQVVEERRMPPWHADSRHGTFANNRSLSSQDRGTLLAWVDQGCARGEGNAPSAAFEPGDNWLIGKPDAIFTMPSQYPVPAKAARGIRYQYIVIPTNFSEDRWIQAAEARPGYREVVHHIIVYVRQPGLARERTDGIGDGMLVAFAPGDMPSVFPPGTAKKLPKGSVLVLQMHYTPNGTAGPDRSSVGLIFAKEPPQHEAHTRSIAQSRFSIPPGSDNYKVTSATTFRSDAVLISLLPHMHLRGKDFEYLVIFPDGKTETLLSVPHYDFNWQTNYRLAQPRPLPAGTRIECTAHFDNSTANFNNPDPTKTVRWGEQTWDEMMIGFVDYYYLDAPRLDK